MKIKILVAAILAANCFFYTFSAAMDTAVKIAFVDVKKVFNQYSGTADIQKILTKEIKAKEEEVAAKEAEIRKMKQEYSEKKLLMNEDAKKKKEREITAKEQAYLIYVDEIKKVLTQKENLLLEGILAKVIQSAKSIAESKSYDYVIEKSAVLYGGDDITPEVIKSMEGQQKP